MEFSVVEILSKESVREHIRYQPDEAPHLSRKKLLRFPPFPKLLHFLLSLIDPTIPPTCLI